MHHLPDLWWLCSRYLLAGNRVDNEEDEEEEEEEEESSESSSPPITYQMKLPPEGGCTTDGKKFIQPGGTFRGARRWSGFITPMTESTCAELHMTTVASGEAARLRQAALVDPGRHPARPHRIQVTFPQAFSAPSRLGMLSPLPVDMAEGYRGFSPTELARLTKSWSFHTEWNPRVQSSKP